jgi:hypothetical protein
MTPSNLRKGDTVTIEAVVDYATENYVYVVTADHQQFTINRSSNALKLARAECNVGDRVVVFNEDDIDTGLRGTVVAIRDIYLWLDCGVNEMRTALAYRCQRIEPEPEPVDEPAPVLAGDDFTARIG